LGHLIDGAWVGDDVSATDADGRWHRTPTVRRDWIRADGSTPHTPEAGRYHLWLAYNCTWSQRTMIVRNLLGLQDVISYSMAHWHRNDGGWWFRDGIDDLQPDTLQPRETWDEQNGFQPAEPELGLSLHRVYTAGDPHYTGRATVPTLWDRKLGVVVSNESSDILRMVETELRTLATTDTELLPAHLIEDIDATNAWVYPAINNGVYRVGFARSQGAYEEALSELFAALDRVDDILARQRYLCGDVLTEADIRLFPTLIRFDAVYNSHFKCSRRRVADYPHISGYTRELYQMPAIRETVRIDYYKLGYMGRSEQLNPSRIIRSGPDLDLDAPHGRGT
jgi:putative glutathione S-transferase